MMHLKIKIEYPLKFFSMYKYPVKVLKYESYQFSECASIGIVLLRLLLWNVMFLINYIERSILHVSILCLKASK